MVVYHAPEIPSVTVNGVQIPWDLDNKWFQERDFDISPGDTAELLVAYTKSDGSPGSAQSVIKVPDHFEITSHDTSLIDSLPIGGDLGVTWSSSDGADAYSVYFSIRYYYYDTTGSDRYFYYMLDTLFADTSITFASSLLFPNANEIDSLDDGFGNLDVTAVSGPIGPGAEGNITGDGIGFFHGWTYGADLYITVHDST